MGKFEDWGFTKDSWKGSHGEYWVLAQGLILLGLAFLPKWHPTAWENWPIWLGYGRMAIALLLAGLAAVLLGKGLLDLGENLTPLPYPRDSGTLVQTGVYSIVRHCLYSGLILGTAAYSLWTLSVPHFLGAVLLLLVLDMKARKEEAWLIERYPDYEAYRQRVKKFIPWIY
ncbi:MAG: isoprenylcysteine carboxylmethyltransferase family protein [Leptolyngbya sp. SIO1E4]|nr:isoprenylcysteine carboxylmethyltransferase family protein [Leptolyngbya sp. SIO1E4]